MELPIDEAIGVFLLYSDKTHPGEKLLYAALKEIESLQRENNELRGRETNG